MTKIPDEARGTAEHGPEVRSSNDYPAEPIRVTVQLIPAPSPSPAAGESPLGRRLRAIRDAALAEGMPVMTQDEVLAEVRLRRVNPADHAE